jgi:type IV pilus assembly protein PilA
MVIIIIAILAAIAVPTFLGQRQKAQDAAAITLVRNALTVVESVNVDTKNYAIITAGQLAEIEPSIAWNLPSADLVVSSPPSVTVAVVSLAGSHGVDFFGQAADRFDVASVSDSGNRYGIEVVSTGSAGASFVKVSVIDGQAASGW